MFELETQRAKPSPLLKFLDEEAVEAPAAVVSVAAPVSEANRGMSRTAVMAVINPKNLKPIVKDGVTYCLECKLPGVDKEFGLGICCMGCTDKKWKQYDRDHKFKTNKNVGTNGKKKITKRTREQMIDREEDYKGPCKQCGNMVTGGYLCDVCLMKKHEAKFTLKQGEVELYRGNDGPKEDNVVRQIVAIDADSIEPDNTEWIWQDKIPDGSITWILGQPNNAKSVMTIEIAACATTGKEWPDGSKNTVGAVKVLMYCGEDSLKKVVVPRLIAAGADRSKIKFLDRRSFRTMAGDNDPEKRPLNLTQDLDILMELIKENPGYKMIIVDPITSIFGDKNIGKNEEVDPVLQHLIDFCEEAKVAFVGVTHVPKRQTNMAIEKIAGGSAVAGSAKSAFMLSRDPESDNKNDHILTMVKYNYTGNSNGQKFSTKGLEVEFKGKTLKTVKIAWGEITTLDGNDIMAHQNSKKEMRDKQADACEMFLLTFLADGPQRSPDVYAAALAAGKFSDNTVRNALKRIGGGWYDRRNQREGYWMTLTPNTPFPFGETMQDERVMANVEQM
jgi:putative DNA primase/helicase